MNKKSIEIFMKNEVSGCGCGCSCSCNSDQYVPIDELADRFNKKYGDIGEAEVHEISENKGKDYIERLNDAFKKSGERLIISSANMDFVYKKILPLILVDGKIISVTNYPDEEQLYQAVTTGKRIPKQPSCC